MTQTKLIYSGSLALIGNLIIIAATFPLQIWLSTQIPSLLTIPLVAWSTFLTLIFLALLEIPVMIYGLRKIAEGETKHTATILLYGNCLFIFFPIVYALPNLLLTGPDYIWMGLAISITSLLRFGASLLFLSK